MHGDSVYTYFDQDMVEPEAVAASAGVACIFSARCPAKETPNEDAGAVICVDDQTAVLVVADGMGGSAAGEHAARLAVECLEDAVAEALSTDTLLRSAIITGFERANVAVQELGVGAGTTMAVVELSLGTARPYHVGDSMILVAGGRGRIKFQTVPHSPVGYGVEAGLIDEDEAMHHEHRHVVSNFIGSPEMHIAIGPPIKLARRDTVLLASDGLFDNLYSDQIVEIIRRGKLTVASQRLANESHRSMLSVKQGHPSKPDDLTFIAFRPNA